MISLELVDAEATFAIGVALGKLLQAGDLLILAGDLGAGKTTLTAGIGVGMGVRGPITSPTFVIARSHPSLVAGPRLVHIDAYRLGSEAELADLDIETELVDSAVVVEWGTNKAEFLNPDRLEIRLERDTDPRVIHVNPVGTRWSPQALASLPAALTQ